MRNRALHDALRDFALEAAALLTDELKAGAELEFDVVEDGPGGPSRRGGPALYRYQPRTGAFIGERWEQLRALPACERACAELGTGASAWLRVNGLRGEQAEPALQAMLERLYEDATSFGFPEERFERVYREVELTLYRDAVRARVAARLEGAWMDADRIDLGDGLSLVKGNGLDLPRDDRPPSLMCVLERDVPADEPIATEDAAERFAALVTAMRLWQPGSVVLGAPGWRQTDEGKWQPLPIGSGGEPPAPGWALRGGDEQAFAEFFVATAGVEAPQHVTWALARFDMGCERELQSDALSDHLLALRALLDATTDAGRATFALRVAALCAEEDARREVQQRVEAAGELERLAMGARVSRIEVESPELLPSEIEGHLRALLRDVLCGYLSPELKTVADEILIESGPDPLMEIEARDLRKEPRFARGEPRAEGPPPAPPPAARPPAPGALREAEPLAYLAPEPAITWEPELEYEPEQEYAPEPVPAYDEPKLRADQDTAELEPVQHQLDGVTESADWGWDPEDYSAPV